MSGQSRAIGRVLLILLLCAIGALGTVRADAAGRWITVSTDVFVVSDDSMFCLTPDDCVGTFSEFLDPSAGTLFPGEMVSHVSFWRSGAAAEGTGYFAFKGDLAGCGGGGFVADQTWVSSDFTTTGDSHFSAEVSVIRGSGWDNLETVRGTLHFDLVVTVATDPILGPEITSMTVVDGRIHGRLRC